MDPTREDAAVERPNNRLFAYMLSCQACFLGLSLGVAISLVKDVYYNLPTHRQQAKEHYRQGLARYGDKNHDGHVDGLEQQLFNAQLRYYLSEQGVRYAEGEDLLLDSQGNRLTWQDYDQQIVSFLELLAREEPRPRKHL